VFSESESVTLWYKIKYLFTGRSRDPNIQTPLFTVLTNKKVSFSTVGSHDRQLVH